MFFNKRKMYVCYINPSLFVLIAITLIQSLCAREWGGGNILKKKKIIIKRKNNKKDRKNENVT